MAGGQQSTAEYTGPSIGPLMGGVIGATKIGGQFMRGYSLASEMQLREYERRKKWEQEQALNKALGMPIEQFEGEAKLRQAGEEKRQLGEKQRLMEAESQSRRPMEEPFSFGSFRYLSKPPAIPPDVSEPPSVAAPNYIDSRGQTRIEEEGGPAAALTAPTFETPTPSEITGQGGEGFTERPPTAEEIWKRQVQSGVVGAESAVKEERTQAEETRIKQLRTAAEKIPGLTDAQRTNIELAIGRSGAAGGAAQLRLILNEVEEDKRRAVSDEQVAARTDLDDDQKNEVMGIKDVSKRPAAINQYKKLNQAEERTNMLRTQIGRRIDVYEKGVDARIEEMRRKREDPTKAMQSFEGERDTYLREISRLRNELDNPLTGLRLFAAKNSDIIKQKELEMEEYRQKARVAQEGVERIRSGIPGGSPPPPQRLGGPEDPGETGGTGGASAAAPPGASPPPPVPGGVQHKPWVWGDESQGLSTQGAGAASTQGPAIEGPVMLDENGNLVPFRPTTPKRR